MDKGQLQDDQHLINDDESLKRQGTVRVEPEVDPLLKSMHQKLQGLSEGDNEEKYLELLDTWIDVREKALQEILLDKQFWAFLRGYLNMKMNLLLENQASLLETTIQMFVKSDMGVRQQRKEDQELLKNLTIGDFLTQLKEEEVLQIKFNRFLIDQFIKETAKIRKNPEQDV